MSGGAARFPAVQRVLHWGMAVMVLAMLFIGVTMVSTVAPAYLVLLGIHKPLGIAILVLAVARLGVRWWLGVPPLPVDLPPVQVAAARLSHFVLYALLIAMPLVGWGMLSAGGYPVVLAKGVILPAILPHEDTVHAVLREAHTVLAYLLFATILLHLAAALFHGLVRRDGVLASMATLRVGRRLGA